MGDFGNTSVPAETLCLPAERNSFERLAGWLEERLTLWGVPVKTVQQLMIVADEIFTNVASYAYPEGGTGEAAVTLKKEEDEIVLTVSDSGKPYDPLNAPPPDTTLPLEGREIGGLGIFMVKKLTDSQSYEWRDGKNILTIRKKL